MRHSKQHSGLQDHSVGELYPWSIVQIGDQFVQARHGITGEQGPEFTMESMDSRHAYKLAEHWVKDKLASSLAMAKHAESIVAFQANQACEPDAMQALVELRDKRDDVVDEWKHGVKLAEYSFIVPRQDNSGNYFPTSEFDAIEHKLLAAFYGFSRLDIYGEWVDDGGNKFDDISYQYSVAFKSTNANIDKLLQIVAYVKTRFDQEKIYISQDSSNVRLV